MAESEETIPTVRELQILKVLWDSGPSTVRDVYEQLRLETETQGLAQNTVQTFLRLMEDKGLVAHATEGRAFIYRALYTRQRSVSGFLSRVFDGAATELVSQLLDTQKLSDEELSAIERMIRDARKKH